MSGKLTHHNEKYFEKMINGNLFKSLGYLLFIMIVCEKTKSVIKFRKTQKMFEGRESV